MYMYFVSVCIHHTSNLVYSINTTSSTISTITPILLLPLLLYTYYYYYYYYYFYYHYYYYLYYLLLLYIDILLQHQGRKCSTANASYRSSDQQRHY